MSDAKTISTKRNSMRTMAILVAVGAVPTIGHTAVIPWSATATTDVWATAVNWVGGVAPVSGATDQASFVQTSYANHPTVTANRTVGGLIFGDGTTSTAATVIGTSAAATLNLQASGIAKYASSGEARLTGNYALSANQTWSNDSSTGLIVDGPLNMVNRQLTLSGSGPIELNGVMSGTGSTVISSTGTVTFGAAHTYSGLTTVSSGTLKFANGGSLVNGGNVTTNASAIIDLNGQSQTWGTLNQSSAGNAAIITNTSASPASLTIGNFSRGSGSFTGNLSLTVNAAANNSSFTGGFTNTGDVAFNAGGAGSITVATNGINNSGTIANAGTGTGVTTIAGIGASVTGVIQDSDTSVLRLGIGGGSGSGNPLWDSGLLIRRGTVELANFANAGGADGNVITLGDSSVNADATLAVIGSAGAGAQAIVVNAGGTRTIAARTGSANATFSGPITLNHGLTLQNVSASNGGVGMVFSGGITGTGDLVVYGDSNAGVGGSSYQGIQLTTTDVNPIGTITNAGVGAYETRISAAIGENVTGVTQNSATSPLILLGTNRYLAQTRIDSGLLAVQGGGTLANADIIVAETGEFQLHGESTVEDTTIPASTLTFNIHSESAHDMIDNAGVVSLAGYLQFDIVSPLADGAAIDLLIGAGSYTTDALAGVSVAGAYVGILSPVGSLYSGVFGLQELSFDASTGLLSVVAVPEPGLPMLLIGAAALGLRRRRS